MKLLILAALAGGCALTAQYVTAAECDDPPSGPLAGGERLLERAVAQIRREQAESLEQRAQLAQLRLLDSVKVLAAGAPSREAGYVTLE